MAGVQGWSRTAGDIVAETQMAATNTLGVIALVEGPSDEMFFSRRFHSTTHLIQCQGRRNVEEAMRIIGSDPAMEALPILGIVDEDYDWAVPPTQPIPSNVVKFDPRDLEGLLLRSNALSGALAELGDRAKIQAFEATHGSIRDAIAHRAAFFGRLRIYNLANNRICLKKLKPQRFCDVRDWTYDEAHVIREAVRLGVHTNEAQLHSAINGIQAPDIWHVVRGHDAIDIFVGGLLGVLGNGGNVSQDRVEAILRQSIQDHEFETTGLYCRLTYWESQTDHTLFCCTT